MSSEEATRVDAAGLPTLSVVIPAYNAASWLPLTIEHLRRGLKASPWRECEVIVVDDGSTDHSAAVVEELAEAHPGVRVIQTANQGRFLARRTGIEAATGSLVLLLDTRVFISEQSLSFLADQLLTHPDRVVWNSHVETDGSANPYARFWDAITFVAWRRYLANPRYVSYGLEDFDYYPKGTTCFLAPREDLLASYRDVDALYDDPRLFNDDTSLIRRLAERRRINLAPDFSCRYHARDSLGDFLRHTAHRGVVFVDGYLRPSTRYFWPLVSVLVMTVVWATAVTISPVAVLLASVLGLAAGAAGSFVALVVLGVPPASAGSFAVLSVPFAIVYGLGIWRGLLLAAWKKVRR